MIDFTKLSDAELSKVRDALYNGQDAEIERILAPEPILEEKEESRDFLELASQAYYSSNGYYDANLRPRMTKDIQMFMSKHSTDSRYNSTIGKYRSKYFVPKVREIVRKHEAQAAAAYFSTQDVVNISAYDPDNPIQQAAAEFFRELINARLTGSKRTSVDWFQYVIGGYQDAMTQGVCFGKMVWNKDQDKPDGSIVEPEYLLFDPSANWMDPVNTSPYVIELRTMYVFQIKQAIKSGAFLPVTDAQILAARRSDYSSVRDARDGGREDPKKRSNTISDYDIVWVHHNIMKIDGEDYVFDTLFTQALLSEPKPIKEVYLTGRRPYIMGKAIFEAHVNHPSSLPTLLGDAQKMLNDITNQRIDNVRQVLDKRYQVKRGARVDHDSLRMNAPGSITMVDNINEDVGIIPTPDVTSSSYREAEMASVQMDGLAGGFASSTIQNSRALSETVGGMNLASQAANQVSEYQLKVFNETFVEESVRHLLDLLRYYETDETIIALAGRKAELLRRYKIEYITDDLFMQDVDLSVSVGMGAVNPVMEVERFMMAIRNAAQAVPEFQTRLNVDEVAKEIFGKLGYKDGKRFIKPDFHEDPEKAALIQQIQQLQQQLEAKKPKALIDAEVKLKEAQAIKTNVEAMFGGTQAAQTIALMPAVSPIADSLLSDAGMVANPQDPNLDSASNAITPELLREAQAQAKAFSVQSNNDPMEPNTGQKNFNMNFSGGKNGIKDR